MTVCPADSAPRELAADQRGSILIPGMFMGIVLVLSCMHVIGVTEAVLIRSMGQNAADAIAMEGAVWHAQGMNLLVLLNILMAALMAVIVAIRVAELLLIGAIAILLVAGAIASFFSFGAAGVAATALARQLTQTLVKVHQFEDKWSPRIMEWLDTTYKTECMVAAVMPYVSFAHPVTNSADLDGDALAVSLFPSWLEMHFSKAPQNLLKDKDGKDVKPTVAGFEVETGFPARMGTLSPPGPMNRFLAKVDAKVGGKGKVTGGVDTAAGAINKVIGSLPAQEEDFFQVCARGSELLGSTLMHLLGGPFGLGDAQIEKVSSFIGVLFGSLQSLTCTPISKVGDTVKAEIDKSIRAKCDQGKIDFEKDPNNKGKKWDKKKDDECKEKELKNSGYKKPIDAESLKVARLWGVIANPKQSPFLHVWSFAPIADFEGLEVEPANAMAEFRHVCDTGVDHAQRGCNENSMWRPGWYAKMVPVRNITDELKQKYGEILAGWFTRALGKSITAVLQRVVKRIPTGVGGSTYMDMIGRHLGTTVAQRTANGWWNRRFLTGTVGSALGIARLEALDLQAYPEFLH